MLNPLASCCVYWAESLIAYIYFSEIFEHRFSRKICFLFGFCLYSLGSLLNLMFRNDSAVNLFVTLLLAVTYAIFCFRGSIIRNGFYAIVLVVVNTTIELIILNLSVYITGNAFLDYNADVLLFLFEAICSKGLYFLAVLVLIRVVNPRENTAKIPLSFLLSPVASIFCLGVFWRICAQLECPPETQILAVIAAGGLFLSSILLFMTYSRQAEKDSEALQIKSELARLQTEQSYYQILDQQNQQLMLYAHDAKKHLAAIQALNDDPQIGDYVKRLSEQLSDYTRSCHSGNKLLDVMLHKYAIDCEMRGIHFEYDVKVCNLSQLDDIDLVAILGNLLDNAVTAAEISEKMHISLTTVHRNSYSVLIVSNSCDVPPKQSGARLVSTKTDGSLHGFGMKSVAKTIQKYQGDYEWEYDIEKKVFTITAMVADDIPVA